ncbi:hypothetical protein ASD8599_00167 [Ascidiaceihabitans donghaensis]|uniref:HTH marR-type domain-containing protein n=2 Tax=Paracoccaceae TaxID=31989 RepID=A0A2R8B983_9RHOB|nr:hypothetical protein ASD8599_00167 [Ascidiaceihabitans donghaensis]
MHALRFLPYKMSGVSTAPNQVWPMSADTNALAISLFSEVLAADQTVRNALGRVLPKGMEISHFSVLNHLTWHDGERSPAQLAQTFNVTRGAMTNTLAKLEWAGYIHVRPDWDDARRKMVAISPAGRNARDQALSDMGPMVSKAVESLGEDRVREALPILREIRKHLT